MRFNEIRFARDLRTVRLLWGVLVGTLVVAAFGPEPALAVSQGAGLQGAVTPRGGGALVDPAVWAALDTAGVAAVIVEHRDTPIQRTADAAGDHRRRAALKADGDSVLAALPAGSVSAKQRVDNWPMFAVLADRAAVESLRNSPDVIRITANESHRPSLSVSVPYIGGTTAFAEGFSGSGQTVAILDTGVDSAHPFLGGRVVAEACFSSDISGLGYSAVCPGGDPTTATGPGSAAPCPVLPECRHGTHVAGIAAGDGLSQTGVAKDAGIIAVEVFSKVDSAILCGGSPPCALYNDFDLVRGLDFVYSMRSAYDIAAANMSLGGFLSTGYCDYAEQERPFSDLRNAGIAPVVAAGNDGSKIALGVPACTSNAVSVGATSKSADTVASFSNSNDKLTLLAPGVSVNSSVPGGGFANMSGTSMATPHITGALAVLAQQHPTWSVTDLTSLLRATGAPVTDSANGLSHPRVRLDGAVRPPTYHPIDPVRVADTRVFPGIGLGPGATVDLSLASVPGIPTTGVSALMLNLTGVGPTTDTHFTMYPKGYPLPGSSNLNLRPGETRANQAAVKMGGANSITVRNNSGVAHLVLDVTGYVDDGGTNDTGDHFDPMLPKRVADTRDGTGGVPAAKVGPGGSVDIDVAASCPTPGATTAALNLTITGGSSATHLTAFATGDSMPPVSNVNAPAGATVPNLANVEIGAGGKITVVNNSGAADVIADLFGCFRTGDASETAGRFVPIETARVVDTRAGLGTNTAAKIIAGAVTALPVGGRGGTPSSGMKAALVNITATNNEAFTHISVAPTGLPAVELLPALSTSVLNVAPGETIANTAIVPVGGDGKFLVSNYGGATDIIVDVLAWVS